MSRMIPHDPANPHSAPASNGTFGLGSSKKSQKAGIENRIASTKRMEVSWMVMPWISLSSLKIQGLS